MTMTIIRSPAVQRQISTNPRLNFILGFFTPLFKSSCEMIFLIPFSASKHQIVDNKRKKSLLNYFLKLSDLKLDFTLTLSYLNPTKNSQALNSKIFQTIKQIIGQLL